MRLYLYVFVGLVGLCGLKSYGAPITRDFLLCEHVLYELPISRKCPTTIVFPGNLDAIEGVGVTQDDKKAPVRFAHVAGRPYFTVKAISEKAEATLNVIYQGNVYSLKLMEAPAPFRKVRFYEKPQLRCGTEHRLSQAVVTPQVLLSLLDQAKLYPLLKDTHPELTEALEHSQPLTTDDYGSFVIVLEEVLRFERYDTLVFRLRFTNTTDLPVAYAPQSLMACVGTQAYPASLVDASGVIPASGQSIGYFCITGKPEGGKAHLALQNRFQISVYTLPKETVLNVL